MSQAHIAQPILLAPGNSTQKTRTPLGDAWYQLSRNRLAVVSLIFILFLIVLAFSADLLKSTGFIEGINDQHRGSSLAVPLSCATLQPDQKPYPPGAPQFCFVFGSDNLGRDVFSRTLYGTRVSLLVALVGASMSLGIGVIYGVISGYYGGRVDNVMMRFIDFLYGIPSLVLIILLQTFFKSLEQSKAGGLAQTLINIDKSMGGLFFLFIALSALSWIHMARLVRGEILSYKNREFVEAARALGASDFRIIFVHLLPNITGPLIVAETLEIPAYIFTEAFLSFIGLGVDPPTPSWGSMISAGRESLTSFPNLILVPGIALALTTLAFNFLGDGLRDALDPHMRGK
ncbi:MAG: ABC transporter permease [Chloroflexi bacterium]|nr:ABC transporter permease [Chloroflexota bacterium]MCC6892291.1 ABC transporter permease [Anaerolineae bacterium]